MKKREVNIERRKSRLIQAIDSVKPRLHRIALSGPYGYTQLKEVFKSLKINPKYRPYRRRRSYKTQAFSYYNKQKLTIFLNPSHLNPRAQCVIETSYPTKKFLFGLSDAFPHMTVSIVEYALDIFFADSTVVRRNYRTLMRYLWFPYQKEGKMYASAKLNSTRCDRAAYFKAGKIVVYERGPEAKSEKDNGRPFWFLDDCDRIRIENRIDYPVLYRTEDSRSYLASFVMDPGFRDMNRRFRLGMFRQNTLALPTEYDVYREKDENGHSGYFYSEYLAAKKNVHNITRYVVPVPVLEELNEMLTKAMVKFDKNWREANSRRYEYLELGV
jgi:hypothetical protein